MNSLPETIQLESGTVIPFYEKAINFYLMSIYLREVYPNKHSLLTDSELELLRKTLQTLPEDVQNEYKDTHDVEALLEGKRPSLSNLPHRLKSTAMYLSLDNGLERTEFTFVLSPYGSMAADKLGKWLGSKNVPFSLFEGKFRMETQTEIFLLRSYRDAEGVAKIDLSVPATVDRDSIDVDQALRDRLEAVPVYFRGRNDV